MVLLQAGLERNFPVRWERVGSQWCGTKVGVGGKGRRGELGLGSWHPRGLTAGLLELWMIQCHSLSSFCMQGSGEEERLKKLVQSYRAREWQESSFKIQVTAKASSLSCHVPFLRKKKQVQGRPPPPPTWGNSVSVEDPWSFPQRPRFNGSGAQAPVFSTPPTPSDSDLGTLSVKNLPCRSVWGGGEGLPQEASF